MAEVGHAKASSSLQPAFKHLLHADSEHLILDSSELQIMNKLQLGTLRHGVSKTKQRQLSECPQLNEPGCGLSVPQMKRHSTEPKSGWKDLLAQIQCHENVVYDTSRHNLSLAAVSGSHISLASLK